MAKDPAFLFYPNDWVGGTMGMTFEEKGAYMELLMMQFNRGHMTEHMICQTVGQLFGRIKDKFIQDAEGLWYNERLDIEKEKRKNYVNSRNNNRLGENQYTKKIKKDDAHMSNHMDNVNESVNEFINKKEDNSKKPPTKQDFMQYVRERCAMVGYDFNQYEVEAGVKYDAWVANGWVDLRGNKIDKWKGKVVANLQYWKSKGIVNNEIGKTGILEVSKDTNYSNVEI